MADSSTAIAACGVLTLCTMPLASASSTQQGCAAVVCRNELAAGQYTVMVLGYALESQYELTIDLVETQRELRPAAALALGQASRATQDFAPLHRNHERCTGQSCVCGQAQGSCERRHCLQICPSQHLRYYCSGCVGLVRPTASGALAKDTRCVGQTSSCLSRRSIGTLVTCHLLLPSQGRQADAEYCPYGRQAAPC